MGRPAGELLTSREEYIGAWRAAQGSACGVALRAFPRDSVYQRLLQIRRELGDPALKELEIVKPAHAENELWIIKKRD